MNYVLGIDLGTSGVKCLLVSENGVIIGRSISHYKPDFKGCGCVEQNPSVWWESTKKAVKDIIHSYPESKGKITALSCSGQMHSSVFLNSEGKVIRNAILWNDTRTTLQVEEIYKKINGLKNLLSTVYNPALEGFTLPKILWLRENEPENFEKLYKVIMPKDYINYMFTGNIFTDISDASGTLLFDIKNSRWSKEILAAVNLDISILPSVLKSTDIIGNIKKDIAEELGLSKEVKVIAGGADNSCAAIGNGITKKGQSAISIGTSGTVIAYSDKVPFQVSGDVHIFNYSVPNSFYIMGCMLCAGEALNWLQRTVFEQYSFDDLNIFAQEAEAGSKKLIFMPYLFGERCPYNNAAARGIFFGISGEMGKSEIIRSVMEGVAYGLKDLFNLVEKSALINEIYITGGGAKSKIWAQIISDVIGRELNILNIEEGPSFGAALISLVGSGIYNNFSEAKDTSIKIISTIEPSKNTKIYSQLHDIYKKLYSANKDIFNSVQNTNF